MPLVEHVARPVEDADANGGLSEVSAASEDSASIRCLAPGKCRSLDSLRSLGMTAGVKVDRL